MAAASFFGHALLGLGPGIAFFLVIIAPKSFVVLLSLFSAFLWLVVMLLTSAVLRGFVPTATSSQPVFAAALIAAVAIEELARYGVWRLHKKTVAVLHHMSESSGHTFTPVDELYLAVGWGYGHAAVHVLIMFGSLLPLTAGHGTLYAAECPQVSLDAGLGCQGRTCVSA
jgi:anterior pharynx defective protein 1